MITPRENTDPKTDINEDEIPPLEDMSHLLKTMQIKNEYVTPKKLTKPNNVSQTKKETPTAKSSDFGGFKKGFFSNEPRPKPKDNSKSKQILDNDIPFIKPTQSKTSHLEFKEVRDAMASKFDKSRDEWMDSKFMDKVMKSPKLQKALQDPRFIQLTQDMGKNPVDAVQRCKKNAPEWLEALQEFAGILGDTFESKANELEAKEKLSDFEQGLVDKVMNDKQAQAALKDPNVQKLLMRLRSEPTYITEVMNSQDPVLRQRIQLLVQIGLLQIQ
ncbi:hypothetical protein BC833DRAFT_372867 [Globomyces pollinis-pini]|nr:hypothetical protein BC833DRAFT_372867 [Globomyces pollinis-pini]